MIYEYISAKETCRVGIFLQIEMKCETKVTSNSTGTNAK